MATDTPLFTQLMDLIAEGDQIKAIELLESSSQDFTEQLNLVNEAGESILTLAIKKEFFNLFDLLINKYSDKIDLSQTDSEGNTLFILLCMNDNYWFYKKDALNFLDRFGDRVSPFHLNKSGFSAFFYIDILDLEELVKYRSFIDRDDFSNYVQDTFLEEFSKYGYDKKYLEKKLIELVSEFGIIALPSCHWDNPYCWSKEIDQTLLNRLRMIADSRPSDMD